MTTTGFDLVNPFIGLRPFEEHESLLFFGRSQQTTDLLERLHSTRFVPVIGYSGSGKSSLARAGVVPKLRAGFLVRDRDGWFVAPMRPGGDPLRNLACALAALVLPGAPTAADDYDSLIQAGDFQGLTRTIGQALKVADSNLLILIDQFEELFRFMRADAETQGAHARAADLFVDSALYLAAQREAPIYVLLTMRSDFLGDCAFSPDLVDALNRSMYLVPRMKRAELIEAIVGPMKLFGGAISEAAAERLWSDGAGNPDQLPILQHALMRMWSYGKAHGSPSGIDVSDYEYVGGFGGALDRHLDETFSELQTHGQQVAERVFKCLCEQDANNIAVRRPTRLAEICAVTGADFESVTAVVDVFRRPGRSFLMPADAPLLPETVIDISHESLMRNWRLLARWVREDAEAARLYRRLVAAAEFYERGEAGLWRDPELSIALRWREDTHPTSAWGSHHAPGSFSSSMDFLDRSLAAADSERQYRRKRDRVRTTIGVLAGFLAGSILWWLF